MVYYTKDRRMLEYDYFDSQLINDGKQGKVYRISEDICLKEYCEDNDVKGIFDDVNVKFDIEMFGYFKNNYNRTCMCKLYDLLYDKDISNVVGYTMKYYKDSVDNIVNMPISYLIDNFSLIYDLVNRLTCECIRIVDLHYGNIINTSDGMVIIDYDKYRFDYDTSRDVLEYINKSALMSTFYGIFKNSLKNIGVDIDNNIELKNRVLSLFSVNTTPLVLKYKLRGYSKEIDYIYR